MKVLADLWKDWNERRARLAEFDRADSIEMARVATDLGASVKELRSLVGRGAKAADLLARRMHSLKLDPSRVEPAVMRDLQRCCANCLSKTLCAHELEDRPKEASWPKYCPNELTIGALRADNQRSPT
ncbi:MAG TPA: DUF6455 family protein [Burkholderiaceae bacterium]|nr:DUF6455 family protein [Burkholderiaceae bacterium]